MNSNRPSIRELDLKLKAAKAALLAGKGLFANPSKAVGELYKLDIVEHSRLWKLILELLNEIQPTDYAGGRPPQRSYERETKDLELFAFCWQSLKLGKKMYLKFALKNDRYYYLSLHESKEVL